MAEPTSPTSTAPTDAPAEAPISAPAQPPRRVDAAALARHLRRTPPQVAPWLHQEVGRRMVDRLAVIRSRPALLLDWWSQLGASSELLQQHYPQARLLAVEPAATLAARADTPPRWWQRLLGNRTSVHADDRLPLDQLPAQLLWANMMLHWVDDLPALLGTWHRVLAQDGFLMFSCFGPDTLRELRQLYLAAGWGEPASRWIDMHDIGDALVQAGFADPVMDMELLTLTWDSPQALLAELRGLGGNTAPQRQPGLRTPRWQRRFEEQLARTLTRSDGRLHLSFEIVYGHAFRPAPRIPVQAQTEISLQAMREMTRRRGGGDATA
ncbi:MAG: methyltransferase domain-containing protein [Leptothrix sp. (in: b-proteobacteria)]